MLIIQPVSLRYTTHRNVAEHFSTISTRGSAMLAEEAPSVLVSTSRIFATRQFQVIPPAAASERPRCGGRGHTMLAAANESIPYETKGT